MAQQHKHGWWFSQHRMRTGMSQAALAERVGIDRSYVAAIEAGRRWPSEKTLIAILDALGVPLADIVQQLELVPNEEVDRALRFIEIMEDVRTKVTPAQLAELQTLFSSGDTYRMLGQLALANGLPPAPEGWERLGAEDRRTVTRIIHRFLDSYPDSSPVEGDAASE
jgi:transcriptional regulator with XRE-family HTH domain